jgi:hypothetical protein
MEMFLSTADIEANSKETCARHLTLHVIPYIGKQRVAEHRRFKVDHAVSEMVREHIALHGIGPGQVIFPVRLFASAEAAGRDRHPQQIHAIPGTSRARVLAHRPGCGPRPRAVPARRYSETLPRVAESAVRDARCSIPEG